MPQNFTGAAGFGVDGFSLVVTTATCGNGTLEPSEQCDDNNTTAGDCCSATCQYEANGSSCTPDGNGCTDDVCDGAGACTYPTNSAPCDDGFFCTGADSCGGGTCSVHAGDPCTGGPECADVCDEGAGSCNVTAGTGCTDDGNVCTTDACDGSGACAHPAGNAGALCRGSGGVCDVAEFCDGTSSVCPADGFQPATTGCRSAAGVCDLTEHCTGSAATCPADGKSTAECRASGGVCDVAESCDGVANDCPSDGFQPASLSCRGAAGVCDIAETCTGSSAACPADGKSTGVCRPASGQCDVTEICDGANDACPANAFRPNGHACTDADACTTADACNGANACIGGPPPNCDDANVCTADSCDSGTGCVNDGPARDGYACNDDNICTEADACSGGTCAGNQTGADSDADGYCDTGEIQRGCDPNDGAEIPPQAATFGGSPIGGTGNVLVTYLTPLSHKVAKATDPSCKAAGVCASSGFCTSGAIADPCTVNSDCNQAANTCRVVANYALTPDLAFFKDPTLNRVPFTGFAPLAPGCSRKVDVTLDPAVKTNLLKLKVTGAVLGKSRRDYDLFKYR